MVGLLVGGGAVSGAAMAQQALQGAAGTSAQATEPTTPESGTESGPESAPGDAPAGSVGGMGDVNLYPKRVVMTDREKTATVGLYNRAAASGDYDISISDMMMTTDGQLVDLAAVTDPAQSARVRTASGMLRWSPRRVTLPANEAQMVRIMVRAAPDLPPGEYRSHFLAVSVPPQTGELTIDDAAGGAGGAVGGVGVQIVPRFGISIPVIVRVGETTLNAGLRDMALETEADRRRTLALTITREGTRSAFGDITVSVASVKKPLGEIKGIGVYTEISERRAHVEIDPKADPRLYAKGARLIVTYTDDDMNPGKVLARQEFIVP
ncbi:hypothetical protein [Novosphingobium cyanobacteriorum]|uniref:Pili assembly chaperone N-terminal domain-containing protein n=1 Tax=Novosphingobium cyanobacteriorum TaxID=3024215 RepID=A0ABT6CL96_9SPHN|nr:hypothetical protein [Novosphingobium cyanobacteriorum]MDF8334617.1 hypothetical protein [Novosphingobium cyanobacteriorum]